MCIYINNTKDCLNEIKNQDDIENPGYGDNFCKRRKMRPFYQGVCIVNQGGKPKVTIVDTKAPLELYHILYRKGTVQKKGAKGANTECYSQHLGPRVVVKFLKSSPLP